MKAVRVITPVGLEWNPTCLSGGTCNLVLTGVSPDTNTRTLDKIEKLR
jgi:hypothetical protein